MADEDLARESDVGNEHTNERPIVTSRSNDTTDENGGTPESTKNQGSSEVKEIWPLYLAHTMSSWGDRMWKFSVGLFLVILSQESLRLVATYGFANGLCILILAAVVGDWVDRTPRLKVIRYSLFINNFTICINALSILILMRYTEILREPGNAWAMYLFEAVIIALAIVSQLSSMAMQISMQRDWVVVIVAGNKSKLANINAWMRRIDLTTNILAPIVVGQLMTYASIKISCIAIAGWNVVSMAAEYWLIWMLYKSFPQLAVKNLRLTKTKGTDNAGAIDPQSEPLPTPEHKALMSAEGRDNNGCSTDTGEAKPCTLQAEGQRVSYINSGESSSVKIPLDRHKDQEDRGDFSPVDDVPAYSGGILALTTDQDDLPYKETVVKLQSRKDKVCWGGKCSVFVAWYNAWYTYLHHCVAPAGIGLALLYMTVIGFDSVTIGYAYSQGLSESMLSIMMALGSVTGILGTICYPFVRRRIGVERTGLFAFFFQLSMLVICLASVWAPGTPFNLSHVETVTERNDSLPVRKSLRDKSVLMGDSSSSFNVSEEDYVFTTASPSATTVEGQVATSMPGVSVPSVQISIILFLVGTVLSRFGLWQIDLSMTQILQENVSETEIGIVNGVQHSLNMCMDMLKFILVILLPSPHQFGVLIILSFLFVAFGWLSYTIYSRKVRGHLFHFEKLKASCLPPEKLNDAVMVTERQADMFLSERSLNPTA
ncbi:PREDICTED: solute carrier family 40 member 1-like isoform X2 [Priapulus caudatus]|uniref:Solute carrier family 40 member 1-like isoform X2 n=1 Tax=Priapulus caudatus TaxID=37621 RepID=A0ABM1DRN0_PRICU|nr:PREDICTED: solute carrier family 40 member 1-like isoform X2 [Priapulus caudatus]